MNIPVNRFTPSPLQALSVDTLRRWYWGGEHPWFTDIHRYAIHCELERREYRPVQNWPIEDPVSHLTTEELRVHLQEFEDAKDRIGAHAVRDEIKRRGDVNRSRGITGYTGYSGRGAYLLGFAPC